MEDNSKVVLALLGGLAVGATLGILFAPEKGDETYDNLSQTLKNLGDSIIKTVTHEIDKLNGLKDVIIDNIKSKLKGTEQEGYDDLEHA